LITLSLVAVSLVTSLVLGPSTDVGVLLRDGALVRGLVHDGQWWRVVSANYIHIGGLHLLTNAVGVWMLGRIVEDMFGSWRTVAIYGLAGIGGMLASLYAVPAGITAGASAALFGVLGAVFVELTWHRKRHRLAWSRGVWGAIAMVTVAQLGIGFVYPAMDQWAHGGGLIVGALAGFVFSPNAHWHKLGQHLARLVALAFIAISIASAVFVVRTSMADNLAAAPIVRRTVTGATLAIPETWSGDKGLFAEPDTSSQIYVHRGPLGAGPLEDKLDLEAEKANAAKLGLTDVKTATASVIPLPAGWVSVELIAKAEDAISTQPIRVVLAAKRIDDVEVLTAALYMPDTMARWAPGFFTAMLASIQPAP
ncbi:MAG: rhomboid family intramembrane serine protease, partial [Kofleriaceae bacterium]|nr:rhomboid family intramembrane serine protease [Kofleriaceae bacterium]